VDNRGITSKNIQKNELKKLEISFKNQALHEDEVLVETETENIQNTGQIKAIHQITKGKKKILFPKLSPIVERGTEEKNPNLK